MAAPFDLDREIAAVVAEKVRGILKRREHQAEAWAAFVAAWERRFGRRYPGEIATLCAGMFLAIVGVAWVAELTLARGL